MERSSHLFVRGVEPWNTFDIFVATSSISERMTNSRYSVKSGKQRYIFRFKTNLALCFNAEPVAAFPIYCDGICENKTMSSIYTRAYWHLNVPITAATPSSSVGGSFAVQRVLFCTWKYCDEKRELSFLWLLCLFLSFNRLFLRQASNRCLRYPASRWTLLHASLSSYSRYCWNLVFEVHPKETCARSFICAETISENWIVLMASINTSPDISCFSFLLPHDAAGKHSTDFDGALPGFFRSSRCFKTTTRPKFSSHVGLNYFLQSRDKNSRSEYRSLK